jgi:hypothetical protein
MDMKSFGMILLFLPMLCAAPAFGTEVYRWVDKDGVVHFSQSPPPEKINGVKIMTLEDDSPPGYDPEQDLYGVEAQAERMALLREQMAEKRDMERERQVNSARQAQPPYQQPVQYGYPFYGQRPQYPGSRPPVKPRPPVRPEPYPTDTLRPPGRPIENTP